MMQRAFASTIGRAAASEGIASAPSDARYCASKRFPSAARSAFTRTTTACGFTAASDATTTQPLTMAPSTKPRARPRSAVAAKSTKTLPNQTMTAVA